MEQVPHKSPMCGRIFARKSSLNRHMMTYSTEDENPLEGKVSVKANVARHIDVVFLLRLQACERMKENPNCGTYAPLGAGDCEFGYYV